MHNASVETVDITFKQPSALNPEHEEKISISSHTKDGKIIMSIDTEAWSFKADEIDAFCKSLKKVVEQATGGKKKLEPVDTGATSTSK